MGQAAGRHKLRKTWHDKWAPFSVFPKHISQNKSNTFAKTKNECRKRARNEPEQVKHKIAGQQNTQMQRSLLLSN